jgi:O-antigen ligase/tetratricopeptide (TPR) repeat protein
VLNWLQKYFGYLLVALIFFTAFMPAAGVFPDSQLLLTILTVALLALFLTFNLPIKLTPAHFSFAFFLLASLIAIFFSVWPVNSLLTFLLLLAYFFIFFLAGQAWQKILTPLLYVVILAGTALSLGGLIKYAVLNSQSISNLLAFGYKSEATQLMTMADRAFANFSSANSLAGFLALIIPVIVVQLVTAKKRVVRLLLAFALVVNLITFYLTFSKGGLAVLSFALILIGGFFVKEKDKQRQTILVVALLLFFTFTAYQFGLFARFSIGYALISALTRLELWQAAVKMILSRPLFGFGPGAFGTALPQFQVNSVYSLYTHNSYLQLASEAGILAFVLLVFTFALLLKEGYQKLTAAQDSQEKYLRVGLLASLTTFMLHNFVDYSWYVPAVALLFWFLAGLAVSSPTTETATPVLTKAKTTVLRWQRQVAFALLTLALLPLTFAYIGTNLQVQAELKLEGFSYSDGRRLAKLAVKFFPYNAEGYAILAKAYAEPANPQKHIKEALAAQKKAILFRPTWPFYYLRFADYLALASASPKKVWQNYQKAIKLYPLEPQIKVKAANWLYREGAYQRAVKVYEQAVKLSSVYQADKQTVKSLKTARTDVSTPVRAIGLAHLGLAKSYAQLKQFKQAEIHLKQAEKILGKLSGVIFAQGLIKEKQGKLEEAAKVYRQAAKKSLIVIGEINYQLAQVYLQMGQKEKALAELKKAAKAEPKFLPAAQLYKKLKLKETDAVK